MVSFYFLDIQILKLPQKLDIGLPAFPDKNGCCIYYKILSVFWYEIILSKLSINGFQ